MPSNMSGFQVPYKFKMKAATCELNSSETDQPCPSTEIDIPVDIVTNRRLSAEQDLDNSTCSLKRTPTT
jgi:hypothetical protein